MKLAVMSDIHSNIVAFEACLSYVKEHPVDGIILLGDFVSDCPNPCLTLDRIYQLEKEYKLYVVRGNREEYFLQYRDGKAGNWTSSSYKGSLLYTYEHLRPKDLEWFESLSNNLVIQVGDASPIRLVHGSPNASRELLDYGKENTISYLSKMDTEVMLAGHTHRQMIFSINRRSIINPGSVGVAIGSVKEAHMAYLNWNGKKWRAELLHIPFDYEAVRASFEKSSLMKMANIWPLCILKSMETGVNWGPLCAKKAYDIARSEGALGQDGSIEETYWEKAAKELGIIT